MIKAGNIKEAVSKCIKEYGDTAEEQLKTYQDWDDIWRKINDFLLFVEAICITLVENEELYDKKDGTINRLVKGCMKEWYGKESPKEGGFIIEYCPDINTDFVEFPVYLHLCFIAQALDGDSDGLLRKFIKVKYMNAFPLEEIPDNVECLDDFLNTKCEDLVGEIYEKYFMEFIGEKVKLHRDYKAMVIFADNQTGKSKDLHRF